MSGSVNTLAPALLYLIGDHIVRSEAELAALAGAIAPLVAVGDTIGLWGDLGCGKTVFARGIVRAWTTADENVPSPTFTLVQEYDANPPLSATIYHYDLYRLRAVEEAIELGIEDALTDGVVMIEWPDRLGEQLWPNRLDVLIADGDSPEARCVSLAGADPWYRRLKGANLA